MSSRQSCRHSGSGVRTCRAALILLSSFLIGGQSGSRSRSTASNLAMVRCSVGSFTSPPIGQLGNLFSADRRNKRALLSILSNVFLGSSRAAMDGHYYLAGSYIL